MGDDGRMTQAAFARLIDRSAERVRQYRQQGILELEDDGKLDVAKSIEALILHGDMSRSSLPFDLYEKHVGPLEAGADSGSDVGDLQRQKLVAEVNLKVQQARKARLQSDEFEGTLVSAEDAQRDWFNIARQTRDKLMSIPDRVAAQLAGMTNEHEIHAQISDEIRIALADIVKDLKEEFEEK